LIPPAAHWVAPRGFATAAPAKVQQQERIYSPPPSAYAQALKAAYLIAPSLIQVQKLAISKLNENSVVTFEDWLNGRKWPKRAGGVSEAVYMRQAYTLLFDAKVKGGYQNLYPAELCASITKRLLGGAADADRRVQLLEADLLALKTKNAESRKKWIETVDAIEEKQHQDLKAYHEKRQAIAHYEDVFSRRLAINPPPAGDEEAQMEDDWDKYQAQMEAIQYPKATAKPHMKELLQLDADQAEVGKRDAFLDAEFKRVESDIHDEFLSFQTKSKLATVPLPNLPRIGKRYFTLPWIAQETALAESKKLEQRHQ